MDSTDDKGTDNKTVNVVPVPDGTNLVTFPGEWFREDYEFKRKIGKLTSRIGFFGWTSSVLSALRFILYVAMVYYFYHQATEQQKQLASTEPIYEMSQEKVNFVEIPGENLGTPAAKPDEQVRGTFVVVQINGAIQNSGSPSFDNMLYQLQKASREENLKAVILRIYSPGGSVGGSEKLRSEILRFKKRGVIVIALYDDMAASGAILASVDADYIIASRSSFVGSIGVVIEWLNFTGLMNRYGLKLEVVKSAPMKDIGSPARDPTPEERALLQGLVNVAFERFVDVVAQGRKLPKEKVLEFATGSVFSPEEAIRNGLIDKMSDNPMRDAVEKAMKLTKVDKPLILRPHMVPRNFLEAMQMTFNSIKPEASVPEKLVGALSETPTMRYEWRPVGFPTKQ